MTLESDVDRWLRETNPPLESTFRRVTELILASDPRLTVYLKNGTVQFAFEGDLAAFVQPKGERVSLMFYRGAKISGDFPHLEGDLAAFVQPKGKRVSLIFYRGAKLPGDYAHLEGDGPTARFMRFDDLADVRAKTKEIRALAKAWCRLMAPA